MSRYFIHLYNGTGETRDEQGSEVADLAAAEMLAVDGVRSILSEEVRRGTLDLRGRAEIADQDGRVVQTVRFSETVRICEEKKE
ncbi:hypothetical protein FHS95_001920 [Sphingomonas naasensis]|uniref:DUF6894 domain-containing protein n=1 Tax=Sphingomonas naasensis TaxID=1344951 RepID=A0A4S1WM75_9SPHN|nr:hypothetical protein [Sphingomonas naasensis]NIJ20228.1 hypothetical protein [Sphingomonas naasensis]TGX44371.1 hypothetical protein E5A74_06120 [Sphingomonas naasensis]